MTIHLSTAQLEAFQAVAISGNFSKAADSLCITQPALSQRIKNLEAQLDQPLLVRRRQKIELTETGTRLFQYCRTRELLEHEVIQELTGKDIAESHGGFLRIAAFSSVMRSVIMPTLSPFIRENPKLQFRFITGEIKDLESLLLSGNVDYMISFNPINRLGVERIKIGVERNVMIESVEFDSRKDVYLDHRPSDDFTELFLLKQKVPFDGKFIRSYASDIYGIIHGVSMGLGRGVVPLHLIQDEERVQIVDDFESLNLDIFLYYREQAAYTRLHGEVLRIMSDEVKKILN